jgi:hypothetical protein
VVGQEPIFSSPLTATGREVAKTLVNVGMAIALALGNPNVAGYLAAPFLLLSEADIMVVFPIIEKKNLPKFQTDFKKSGCSLRRQ